MKKLFVLLLFPLSLFGELFDPVALYLTWQSDPLTTMTVVWITNEGQDESLLEWRGVEEGEWHKQDGTSQKMPQEMPYFIHISEIKGLNPGHDYVFRIGQSGASMKFRTLPKNLDSTVRFVVGGDIYHDTLPIVEETNRQAASTSPHFAIQGGDLAYAGMKKANIPPKWNYRWIEWLSLWKRTMITPDGYLIPMVPAIGNHDVNGKYEQTPAQAPIFYALFPFPGKQGYNVLDFGNYLSVVVLDSNHTHPVYGEQAHWLYHALEQREAVPHKFATYHVPAYPSVRKFRGTNGRNIRRYWVPSFEKFHLSATFENHEHAYKRSHPLLNGRINEKGVLYMGDGAWGVKSPRKPKKMWYLAKTARSRHFILVSLMGDVRTFTAIDPKGKVLDHAVKKINY